MQLTIEVDDLAVCYRSFGSEPVTALADFSLRVPAGEILGVLGPNGSGKSSLLGVLAGSLVGSQGRVRVLGRNPTDPTLLREVGFQAEGPLPFRTCTPQAFLVRVAALCGIPRRRSRARVEALLAQVDLGAVASKRTVANLSTGMARRLALAAALLVDPRVLLLDEPTSGLDPEGSLLVMDLLRARAEAGGTVVIASHHLQEIEQTCTRVVMLAGGRKAAEGTLDQLLGTEEDELVVAGLDDDRMARVCTTIADLGGRVVRTQRRREHLFALFRRLRRGAT
ncbi:MAG: ABC transporter ATP-binding protein [Planctomycetota bacterium]